MKIFGTDYDGVIINIEPQKAIAFGDLLHKEWGVNNNEAATLWIEKGGTSRKSKFEHFFKKVFNRDITSEEYSAIESKYGSLLKTDYYPKITLLDGALDMLRWARINFGFTFVSSGVPMDEIKYLIDLNRLSEYFDLVLGTNDLYPSKREHFNKIVSEKKPGSIVFIADGLEDMRIAKEFSAYTIGITTNHSNSELLNAGASKIIHNLAEGLSFIKQLA